MHTSYPQTAKYARHHDPTDTALGRTHVRVRIGRPLSGIKMQIHPDLSLPHFIVSSQIASVTHCFQLWSNADFSLFSSSWLRRGIINHIGFWTGSNMRAPDTCIPRGLDWQLPIVNCHIYRNACTPRKGGISGSHFSLGGLGHSTTELKKQTI